MNTDLNIYKVVMTFSDGTKSLLPKRYTYKNITIELKSAHPSVAGYYAPRAVFAGDITPDWVNLSELTEVN